MAKPGIEHWILTGYLLLFSGPVLAIQNHLLIIVGLAGDEAYRQQFSAMSLSLYRSALDAGILENNIIILSAQSLAEASAKHRVSNLETIHDAIAEINARAGSDDRIFVVLIGHGNPRGDSAVFNLPGPDLAAGALDEALDLFAGQTIVVVNTASASGPFIKALSGKNRVIITATSSGREIYAPIFGELFISAFVGPGADRDKDERISMLEAFDYARHEVRSSYDSDKRLVSEHALLDDNGDGVGSLDPDVDYGKGDIDGALANRTYLQQPQNLTAGMSDELLELSKRKQSIEQSIRELKSQRSGMPRDSYYRQLEVLLVDLALLSREIRSRGG